MTSSGLIRRNWNVAQHKAGEGRLTFQEWQEDTSSRPYKLISLTITSVPQGISQDTSISLRTMVSGGSISPETARVTAVLDPPIADILTDLDLSLSPV